MERQILIGHGRLPSKIRSIARAGTMSDKSEAHPQAEDFIDSGMVKILPKLTSLFSTAPRTIEAAGNRVARFPCSEFKKEVVI
jgi:hypothetical protein